LADFDFYYYFFQPISACQLLQLPFVKSALNEFVEIGATVKATADEMNYGGNDSFSDSSPDCCRFVYRAIMNISAIPLRVKAHVSCKAISSCHRTQCCALVLKHRATSSLVSYDEN
jgi:hypothetical protein